jgi:hypothetical protein
MLPAPPHAPWRWRSGTVVLKTETRKREMSAQRRIGDNDRHDGGHGVDEGRLILTLDAIDRTWLFAAGGKAANLGDSQQ